MCCEQKLCNILSLYPIYLPRETEKKKNNNLCCQCELWPLTVDIIGMWTALYKHTCLSWNKNQGWTDLGFLDLDPTRSDLTSPNWTQMEHKPEH